MDRDVLHHQPELTVEQVWGMEAPPAVEGASTAVCPEGADIQAQVCPLTQINCSAWYPGEGCRLGVCDQAMRYLMD